MRYIKPDGTKITVSSGRKIVNSKHTIIVEKDCKVDEIYADAIAGESIFTKGTEMNCVYVVGGTVTETNYHKEWTLDWY